MRRAITSLSLPASASALVLALAPLLALGCGRSREAQAQPAPVQAAERGEPTAVDVAGDKPVLVVPGNPSVRRPIVHLHGMCENPRANIDAWAGVAKDQGTIVALVGDMPCPDGSGQTKWTDDATKLDARISAAIAAVNAAKGTTLDIKEVLVVGESMGAARAESLAKANPARYSRLVLVGSPQVVSPSNVRNVRAVANLAGDREPQQMAKQATRELTRAGIDAQFFELTGAAHGEYGANGERTMAAAIAFVASR